MTETTIADTLTINTAELADELTGRGSGLRKSKPDADGLTQYVWRMARFHAGHDTSIPVTAAWPLQDYLDEHDVDASVSGVTDELGEQITEELEEVTEHVLAELGENPNQCAARWAQTGAF